MPLPLAYALAAVALFLALPWLAALFARYCDTVNRHLNRRHTLDTRRPTTHHGPMADLQSMDTSTLLTHITAQTDPCPHCGTWGRFVYTDPDTGQQTKGCLHGRCPDFYGR